MVNPLVRDLPVVVIVILGKRVTVDGEPVYHDGTQSLGQVAADAVADRFARVLGRPVRAVASDQSGTCTLVVHPNGRWSHVSRVTSTESEHFPEFGGSTTLPAAASLPGEAVSHALVATGHESRGFWPHQWLLGAVAVVTLLVLAYTVGVLSRIEPASQITDLAIAIPDSAATEVDPEPTVVPKEPAPTVITGVARQRPGGPVRLTIRSSVAPLSVNVALRPVGGTEPVQRTIVIANSDSGQNGRSVQVFEELEPQVYRWQVTADGRVVTGKVRVRPAEPVETVALASPPPEPVVVRTPPDQPNRPPPAGPRGNDPIPPTPQP